MLLKVYFSLRSRYAVNKLLVLLILLIPVCDAFSDTQEQTRIDFANGLFLRGYYEEAIDEYDKYIAQYPTGEYVTTAWRRLGEAAYALEQYDKALQAFETLGSFALDDSEQQRIRLSKGEVLYHLGQYDASLNLLQLLTVPEVSETLRTRALYFAGRALLENQQPAEAVARFKTIIEHYPENPMSPYARYHAALAYVALGQFESAAIEYSTVAALESLDAVLRMESRFKAAEIYDKIAWYGAAVSAYEQLRTEFPDSEYARRADHGYIWALYHDGRVEEATGTAMEFLTRYPESEFAPGLRYLVANALQQLQRYQEALDMYRMLRELHADSPYATRAQHKIAWAHYYNGDVMSAQREATAFLEQNPESPFVPDTAFLLGTILVSEGNYESAYQEFRMVAEQYPASTFGPDALYKSAECLGQLGLMDSAAEIFTRFADTYPDNELAGQARLRAGDARFRSESFELAVAEYIKLLDTEQDKDIEQLARYRLAVAHYNTKNYSEAVAQFRALLERFPDGPYALESRYRIGDYSLRESRELNDAVVMFQAVFDADPQGEFAARALRDLALTQYELEAYDDAAPLFLRLVREYPDTKLNEESYAWLAQYFHDRSQWQEAIDAFEALLAAIPGYAYPERVRFLIADCNQNLGNIDQAMEQYQNVIEVAPDSSRAVEARFRMAQLYEEREDSERAFTLYEEAANANSGDVAARARFRIGELLEAQAAYNDAARSYLQVAILFLHETLSPESLLRAGRCFEQAGNKDQARRAYTELLTDFPEGEQAEQARQSLDALGQQEESGDN